MIDGASALAPPPRWRRFARAFAAAALSLLVALYGAVVLLDPYGLRAGPGRTPTPVMDLNQRFMYPQIVRSGRYDSAVVGTSTVRLLDPQRLGALFGGRFANLGLNAGTPWEQVQLTELFLRHTPQPRTLIVGLDTTWCEADATSEAKRLTPRPFPPWLYDENRLDDWPELLSLQSLEIAARVALHHAGLMPARIRADGFEVFTPPELSYDLDRARAHLWRLRPRDVPPVTPPVRLSPEEAAVLPLPALAWLKALLARVPASTDLVLAFMPIHVAAQPVPGSPEAAQDEACKARIAQLAAARGATVVDFRFPSAVTAEDANYWDPLHYRVGIAERIARALHAANASGRDGPDGFYRVLSPAAAN